MTSPDNRKTLTLRPREKPDRQRRTSHEIVRLGGPPFLATALVLAFPDVGAVGTYVSVGLATVVLLYLVAVAPPHLLFTATFLTQVFSGNWQYIGLPIGLDRLLLVATLAALLRDWIAGRRAGQALRFTTVHALLLLLMGWALVSALAAGTLLTTSGAFALLDRLGLVPFLAFVLAPRLFGERHQRNTLLIGLVALGSYLSVTAIAEGVGLDALVFPRYVLDDAIGIHAERARGPFLEAVAMGVGLFVCAVGALMARRVWGRGGAGRFAVAVAVLCGLGTIFTLTRAVWLGTVVGFAAAAIVTPALRRLVLPLAVTGVAAVLALLAFVPGLADLASDRAGSERPLWDRYNSNTTALNIVEARPLTGVGWQRFTEVSADWAEQAATYPITTVGIEVHNVFLSHAAELGLPGAALYLAAWLGAVVPPLMRQGDEDHRLWRSALVGVAVVWAVVASFGPLSYAFANTALWLFAGIATTTARAPVDHEATALGRPA